MNEHVKSYYQGKTILITGASGYIGWNIANHLVEIDCQIIRASRDTEKLEYIPGKADLIGYEGDYQDDIMWDDLVSRADVIFHLAGQTSAYVAEKDPENDYKANVVPMRRLLEAARKHKNNPVVVYAGTSTQCGIPEVSPVGEKVVDKPITFYDFHKLMAEDILKYYTQQGWARGVSLRLTNVFGPGPKSSNSDRGILNLMIRKAMHGDDLKVYGSGDYLRDYVYIKDVVSVFTQVPCNADKAKGKHYLLGSGIGTSIKGAITSVANIVSQNTGNTVSVVHVDPPTALLPIEFRNFVADTTSLMVDHSISIQYSLEKGIQETVEFLKKNSM
ncbi:NAD-dependent epimerase/dehydratase family protein [bacterium]|nr:NAD-dependent epimerase/dehydratase family protein [bacterium]